MIKKVIGTIYFMSVVTAIGRVTPEWQIEGFRLNESTTRLTEFQVVIRGPVGADTSKIKVQMLADWKLDGKIWKKPPSPETPVKCVWASKNVNFDQPETYRFVFMARVPPVRAVAFQVNYYGKKVAAFWYPQNARITTKTRVPVPSPAPKARAVVYDVQKDWATLPAPGEIVVGNFKTNGAKRFAGGWIVQLLPDPFHSKSPVVSIKMKTEKAPIGRNVRLKVTSVDGYLLKVLERDPRTHHILCEYYRLM